MNPTVGPVIVVAPDSYKGSLTAQSAAAAIAKGILRALPLSTIRSYPMADGGEGTMRALLGTRDSFGVTARDAAGNRRQVRLGQLEDGAGIIEVAEIVAITDAEVASIPVEKRTTLGVGDAMCALLDRGVRKIIVALGGSSTNDGGAGLLVALGMKLLDKDGRLLDPIPEALGQLAAVDISGLDIRLAETNLLVLSDVDNPLTGKHGATAVFGPQKGLGPLHVEQIDAHLSHYAEHLERAFHRSARDIRGSGAAGGLGFALNLLGAQVLSGAEAVADILGIDQAMVGADWVITGEGRSDLQTLRGKAPYVICQRARRLGVPTTLLSGAIDVESAAQLSQHFSGCFSLAPGPIDLSTALSQADLLLANAAEQMARLWAAASTYVQQTGTLTNP